jgi:histidine triad (HIT) family protein
LKLETRNWKLFSMPDFEPDCLFCRMIKGEAPCKKVYEDERAFAFHDIHPQGPVHILVIPKRHIRGLKEATEPDGELIGYCHLVAAKLAHEHGIENGYRTVLNVGPGAGQSVFHLHVHLIGGRHMGWPPG